MKDNSYTKEEKFSGRCFSSRYPLVFDFSFLISIKHIDIEMGLLIVKTIAKDFNIDTVTIRKIHSGGDLH